MNMEQKKILVCILFAHRLFMMIYFVKYVCGQEWDILVLQYKKN